MMTPRSVLNISQNFYIRGGSDSYFLSLGELLAERGHLVVPFCAKSKHDRPSEWARFFPVSADFESPKAIDVARYHYSRAAKKNLSDLLNTQKLDVAHLHIYYGKLTSSILKVLRDEHIPIIQTVHDYKLICPVYTCSRNGKPCEACHGRSYWRAFVHKCNRDSLVRSAISMSESYTSRWLGSVDSIDRFIAVSHFFADKMKANGIDASKINVIPNFVDLSRFTMQTELGRYMVYFGRIEQSKGIVTLIDAMRQLPHIPLFLAGEGSFLEEAKAHAAGCENIQFVGFKKGEALYTLVGGAVGSILPAEAYENCPVSILEAFALGRPVIGSRIGGIPELIYDEIDGYLFDAGNVEALREAIAKMWAQRSNPTMGRAARMKAEQRFSAEVHYERIKSVYEDVLSRH